NNNFMKESNTIFNLIVPSSYYPHKNLEIIPKICDVLVEGKRYNFRFNFMLKENEFNKIKAMCKNKDSYKLIFNYGPVDYSSLALKYLENDAVFLPTLAESSTSAYPEAFISHRPLLTSDRDFSRGLCKDAAIYFDPFNPDEIAQKIINLSENKSSIENLVCNGLEQLKTYNTPQGKWEKQLNIINSLILGKI